jgi:hypothetical protein
LEPFKFYDCAFHDLLLQSCVLRIARIYTNLLYIIHISVCICVRFCFPSTSQLIFIMDARGVPCEVAGKSRNMKCLVEKLVLGHFFHITFLYTCHYCSTSAPNLSAFSCHSYRKDKRAISGNPQRKQCSFGRRGVLDNHFQCVFNL